MVKKLLLVLSLLVVIPSTVFAVKCPGIQFVNGINPQSCASVGGGGGGSLAGLANNTPNGTGSATSITWSSPPSGTANGDCLVTLLAGGSTPSSLPGTIPAGFSLVGAGVFSGTGSKCFAGVYVKTAANEAGPYTWGSYGTAFVEGNMLDLKGMSCTADSTVTNYGTATTAANGQWKAVSANTNQTITSLEIFFAVTNGTNGSTANIVMPDGPWLDISTNQGVAWFGQAPYSGTGTLEQSGATTSQPEIVFQNANAQQACWGMVAYHP